ncbi:50S ribosomal protein L30 [Arthrobacter sp. HMSC08H08]|uniref:50S ribosomal protein L30 n=1 Tax=Arthrobacter sp. HMSC08H08 TaxID=1581143 RepID=UPI0008A57F9E|nr:50S ribosomal protein L30 [Arthrobacter sp. HMSC08H08]OFT23519.1 50S ribosomal protein L30 [Arthrobacter sp. HMSC08H08]
MMKNLTPSDAKLNITLVRSVAGRAPAQRETVRSLGLKRIGHTVERTADAVTVGMVNKVKHLVEVEEAK